MNNDTAVALFRTLSLGASSPLILVNAWDAASARLIEAAGAPAVATTSAGVAWSLGLPDGDALTRSAAVAALRRIVDAVSVPVSADIEGGYADPSGGVARTVDEVLDAGAVGINIEDGFLSPAEFAARIAEARRTADRAGVALFINARTDVFLRPAESTGARIAEAIERGRRYVEAGADGVFVPGAADAASIAALVSGLPAPVNAEPRRRCSPRASDLSFHGRHVGGHFACVSGYDRGNGAVLQVRAHAEREDHGALQKQSHARDVARRVPSLARGGRTHSGRGAGRF